MFIMKTKLSLILISLISSCFCFAKTPVYDETYCGDCDAANQPWKYYLTIGDAPNSLILLPDTPVIGTARFAYDEEQYLWGKALRDTPRGDQAVSDANYSVEAFSAALSEALPFKINKEKTPKTFYLLYHMMQDAGQLATRHAKEHYMRHRPYMIYGENTCLESDQATLSTDGSYPSGHTTVGWAMALVLAELVPEYQNQILLRGIELGQSRVICGYHFQSDVNAGRIMGAAVVARLHADKKFQADLIKAKREMKRILAKISSQK